MSPSSSKYVLYRISGSQRGFSASQGAQNIVSHRLPTPYTGSANLKLLPKSLPQLCCCARPPPPAPTAPPTRSLRRGGSAPTPPDADPGPPKPTQLALPLRLPRAATASLPPPSRPCLQLGERGVPPMVPTTRRECREKWGGWASRLTDQMTLLLDALLPLPPLRCHHGFVRTPRRLPAASTGFRRVTHTLWSTSHTYCRRATGVPAPRCMLAVNAAACLYDTARSQRGGFPLPPRHSLA